MPGSLGSCHIAGGTSVLGMRPNSKSEEPKSHASTDAPFEGLDDQGPPMNSYRLIVFAHKEGAEPRLTWIAAIQR